MKNGFHANSASCTFGGYLEDGVSFQLGYKERDQVFYVSQTNNLGKDMDVTPKIK